MQLTVLPTSEDERRSLQRRFGTRAVENGAYLVVDANQDEMKELLAEKILFNHHDEKPEESAEPALPGPTTAGASLESSDDEAQAPTEIAVVRGPMTAARQQWLASEGVKLVQRMGSGRYVVSGESAAIRSAESKSDWLSLRDYGVVETIGTKVAASVAATPTPGASLEDTDAVDAFSDEAGTEADPAMYDVRCFDNGRLASLRAQLEVDPRVDSVESGSNRLRYYVSKGADAEAALLLDLGRDSTIEIVERYIPPGTGAGICPCGAHRAERPCQLERPVEREGRNHRLCRFRDRCRAPRLRGSAEGRTSRTAGVATRSDRSRDPCGVDCRGRRERQRRQAGGRSTGGKAVRPKHRRPDPPLPLWSRADRHAGGGLWQWRASPELLLGRAAGRRPLYA